MSPLSGALILPLHILHVLHVIFLSEPSTPLDLSSFGLYMSYFVETFVMYFTSSNPDSFVLSYFVVSSYSFFRPNMIHIILRNCYWLVCEKIWVKLPLFEITWQSIVTSLTSGGSSFPVSSVIFHWCNVNTSARMQPLPTLCYPDY